MGGMVMVAQKLSNWRIRKRLQERGRFINAMEHRTGRRYLQVAQG